MSSIASQEILTRGPEGPSLAEEAYAVIRSKIITLELEPGSLISEATLMAKLNFGRTPIREALRLLANEKLVEVFPRRGMFVSNVDVENLAAVSEVRAVLEIKAAELAAVRSTKFGRRCSHQMPSRAPWCRRHRRDHRSSLGLRPGARADWHLKLKQPQPRAQPPRPLKR